MRQRCALLGGTRAVLPLRKLRFIFIQKLDVLVRGRGYGEHGTTPSIFGHETRASMPRTQHFTSFTDSLTGPANTSRLSACTLGRRTRGRTALDKIGIPWPILQSWWRVAWDDWLRMS